MKRGEIWWMQDGSKRRPVVVLTRDMAIPVLHHVTIAPLTSTVRGIPSEVVAEPSRDGVRNRCSISFDNIMTVQKSRLERRLGVLAPSTTEELCRALNFALGC